MGEVQSCKCNNVCDNVLDVERLVNQCTIVNINNEYNKKDKALTIVNENQSNSKNKLIIDTNSTNKYNIDQLNSKFSSNQHPKSGKVFSDEEIRNNFYSNDKKVNNYAVSFVSKVVRNSFENDNVPKRNNKFKEAENQEDDISLKQERKIKINNDKNNDPKNKFTLLNQFHIDNKINSINCKGKLEVDQVKDFVSRIDLIKYKDSKEINIDFNISKSNFVCSLSQISELNYSITSRFNRNLENKIINTQINDQMKSNDCMSEPSNYQNKKLESQNSSKLMDYSNRKVSKTSMKFKENKLENNNIIGSIYNEKSWKKIKITSFITNQTLRDAGQNDGIFQSELNLVTFSESNKVLNPFSLKFCVLSKNELKYYKSRESFNRFVQPSMKLLLTNSISCDVVSLDQSIFKKDKALKYYFFYIKYLFNEDRVEIKTNSQNNTDGSENLNSRVININNENKKIKGKKTYSNGPFDKDNHYKENVITLEITKTDLDFFDTNNTLMFASINKDIIDKWVCVVNYFINK